MEDGRDTQLDFFTLLGSTAMNLAGRLRSTEMEKDGRGSGEPLDLGQSTRREEVAGSKAPRRETRAAKAKWRITPARWGNRHVLRKE